MCYINLHEHPFFLFLLINTCIMHNDVLLFFTSLPTLAGSSDPGHRAAPQGNQTTQQKEDHHVSSAATYGKRCPLVSLCLYLCM